MKNATLNVKILKLIFRQEKLIEADDAMAPISLEYRSAFIILSNHYYKLAK